MNISQLIEGVSGKNVLHCDQYIKDNQDNIGEIINKLNWLNYSTIKHFNDNQYFNDVNNLINNMKQDSNFAKTFINDVVNNNLFIEAPSFSEINIKALVRDSFPPNETVLIKEETLKYIKQKLKVDLAFPLKDVYLNNIFCAPIYIMKLYKLVSHIINARDVGPCKAITKQPLKGRSVAGASRLGQMELTFN